MIPETQGPPIQDHLPGKIKIFGCLADTVREQHKKIMRQAIAYFIVWLLLGCDESSLEWMIQGATKCILTCGPAVGISNTSVFVDQPACS